MDEVTRGKIVFINDSASINSFLEIGDAPKGSIMREHVFKFAFGVHGTLAQAVACCTQPIPKLSPDDASNRLIRIRSESKNLFRENVKNAIFSLLKSYPESRMDGVAFVLDKVLKISVRSILMTSEEYKSVCQALITQKVEVLAADPVVKLSVANIFSKFALEFWIRSEVDAYALNSTQAFFGFVDSWKQCYDDGVELHNMAYLNLGLRESIQHITAIRHLCTKLYVVHNYFCIDNPSIFHLTLRLLQSKNPLFIDLGFGLLYDILSMRSAERFSNYFFNEEKHLSANVAVSALEGLGHLFLPIRNFMHLEDSLKTEEKVIEARTYLLKLSDLMSGDIWEALDKLFWGLSEHVTKIEPSHVLDILQPLIYALQYLVFSPRDIHELAVSMISVMYHIVRSGQTKTVEAIMSYSKEIARIAHNQFLHEIMMHSGETNMEVSKTTEVTKKLLQAMLDLLERIGVPCLERTYGAFEAKLGTVDGSGVTATRKRFCIFHKHDEFERIQDLYRSDYARLQQLEVEMKSCETAHQEALQNCKCTISKLEAEVKYQRDQIAELSSKGFELMSTIQMLENQIQELMATTTETSRPSEGQICGDSKRLDSRKHEGAASADITMIEQIRTDGNESIVSSLDFASQLDAESLEDSVDQMKKFIALIYDERARIPSALRPSFCGMLKHLGEDLYTSQAHFMQEMLQNADDAKFKAGSSPAIYVFLADQSITVGHNEEGMTARDVLALCSAATSNKVAGEQTGQKGLGFKSVYACCKSPVIISKVWRFQFNADPSSCSDEMAYISPTWLDSNPLDLNTVIETLGPHSSELQTIIHLPFKENLKLNTLEDGLRASLNPIVLLCAQRLRNLHVYRIGADKCFSIPSSVSCHTSEFMEVSGELQLPGGFSVELQGFQKWRSKLILRETSGDPYFPGLPWDSNGAVEFLAFEARIQYPRQKKALCGERRQRSDNPTVLRLLFPRTGLEHSQEWPVCATLPVCSVGLPFIMQADWDVVTSRENIKMSAWNKCLVDCFVSIFALVIRDDVELRGSLSKYLVKVRVEGEMQPFWKDFESKILKIIGQQIPSNYVLASASIDSLKIPDELVSICCGMKIVREDSSHISMEVLERCSHQIKIEDVLRCFEDGMNSTFTAWTET